MANTSERRVACTTRARRAGRLRAPLALAAAGIVGGWWASAARAQQQAQGFAVERLYQSAPGAGWFVMDDLSMHGGLGGGLSLSLGYAHRPLQVTSPDGSQNLDVVQHQAFARVALAVTYDRYRLDASFSSPLRVAGRSGVLGNWEFTGPSANLEQNPDAISDVQIGFEARFFGEPTDPVRLGASAHLIAPSGDRFDYLTDDTYRAAGRLLFAGDLGRFAYAGQVGVHVRPLDEAPVPGSPRGSELLFGVAGGARLPILGDSIVVGPEVFGATAFRSFFGSQTTALEGLLTARFDGSALSARRVGIKLGVGAGIHPQFGAPEWRAVVAFEILGDLQAPGNGPERAGKP
jgi:hypothetical protein